MKTKSKSKAIFFLLIILLVPIFLLFGCDELATFRIDLVVNDGKYGTVYGDGTYTENDTVTLEARGLNGKRFIAWVYQDKFIINSDSTYNVYVSEDGLHSTLTFTATKETCDKYTAVFEDDSQQFYTLSSYKFTTDLASPDALPEEATRTLITGGSLQIMIGENQTAFRDVAQITNDFRDRVKMPIESVSQVMHLSHTSSYYVRFNLSSGSGQAQLKTVKVTLGENNVENAAEVKFNKDKTLDLIYTFEIIETVEEEQVVEEISLVITFSPLSYVEKVEEVI